MDLRDNTDTLTFLISDSARVLRAAFERRIIQAGLEVTPAEARTLLNVEILKDGRQLDIAARMGIEPMTVCAFLDKLQAAGLIERQPDPSDRRAKQVVLTPKSHDLIKRIRHELDRLIAQATDGLAEEDVAVFMRVLESVHDNLAMDTPQGLS
ncbi:MarR family winged helix-turn-helix transcriptional regulator [Neorhizobium sp. NPDC001467]|uniref:MarR family winged helix-turn-helix transcriptional regulator n=1 Tax=Neorhizobium sp. NPDC001467 TaxID=3390595 RepID=UPI003D07FA7E